MAELKPRSALYIRPIHLTQAKEFVGRHHRHNIPPVGGKFAVACYAGDTLHFYVDVTTMSDSKCVEMFKGTGVMVHKRDGSRWVNGKGVKD